MNTIAILSNEADAKLIARGGDNFIISPLFVGSGATGWRDTGDYISETGPLTVATAMAASGAAVNAGAGYVGTGITRGRMLSTAMSFLNMRLGVWVANPRLGTGFLNRVPTFARPMFLQGILGQGHERNSAFVELADGGNFDNMGLYELMRRKLGLILVVDGEADSSMALPGLVSVVRRVYEDFGAWVEFVPGDGPERLIGEAAVGFFPSAAKLAKSAFVVAAIHYDQVSEPGTLIYIKLAGLRNLAFTTLGYWAANSEFPNEPTVNQFFTVAQFEAYRDLGFRAVDEMASVLDLEEKF